MVSNLLVSIGYHSGDDVNLKLSEVVVGKKVEVFQPTFVLHEVVDINFVIEKHKEDARVDFEHLDRIININEDEQLA